MEKKPTALIAVITNFLLGWKAFVISIFKITIRSVLDVNRQMRALVKDYKKNPTL